MTDAATKEADLAAIKTQYELALTVANLPKISCNPVVIAALAHVKATYAAFLAAVAEADAAHGLRIWRTYRHARQTCELTGDAFAMLRVAIEQAEDEHEQAHASQATTTQEPSDSEFRELACKGKAAVASQISTDVIGDDLSNSQGKCPSQGKLMTQDDVDNYGEELIDLAKRAAQEAMRPELNALRQEVVSEPPAAAGKRSGPKISVQQHPAPARVSECAPIVGNSFDLRTTVKLTGLATSFFIGPVPYMVSTIYRNDIGGLYQTSILKYPSPALAFRPGSAEMVYRIEIASQLNSVREHIDTVKMALAKPENTWEGTKDYQDNLMNTLSIESHETRLPEMSWTDKRIKTLIMAANINYELGFLSRLFSVWAG